jgi:hypothetical protein
MFPWYEYLSLQEFAKGKLVGKIVSMRQCRRVVEINTEIKTNL